MSQASSETSNPLFETFPALAERIPWTPLGNFPTPVERMALLPEAPAVQIYVKRDDLCSDVYGGNKVRKLEHILADAALADARTLITLGGVGSNHALATTLHGIRFGMRTEIATYDQPPSDFVRGNLRALIGAGARVHHCGTIPRAFFSAHRLAARRRAEGRAPFLINVGGTCRLGCLGHVTAAFELARQVKAGELPLPEKVVVPLGTCGTAAGLIAGFRLAGLATKVTAVRVAEPIATNRFVLRHLAQRVIDYLTHRDPTVPRLRIGFRDFELVTHQFGSGYGRSTPAAEAAINWAAGHIRLEPTYSGKALAACHDLCRSAAPDTTLLFWNTYNSVQLEQPEEATSVPAGLRRYLGF